MKPISLVLLFSLGFIVNPVRAEFAPEVIRTLKTMETIVFPKVEFQNITVGEVIQWINIESKKQDPKGVGIEILIDPQTLDYENKEGVREGKMVDRKISLRVEKASLTQLVNMIASLLGGRYRVSDGKAYLGLLID